MDPIHQLAQLFSRFPGIGARQSRRFVYFLLKQDKRYRNELTRLISGLEKNITECNVCHRYATERDVRKGLCGICADPMREEGILMVVEKDADLDAIEKSGTFKGRYFVLGGTLPILEKDPSTKIRIKELHAYISANAKNLNEIILACAMTPDGEHTAEFVHETIGGIVSENNIQLTALGRGLSTGTELEYSDAETLRWALEGRK